ncbi:MAG: DUF4338 domain-containing protein [Candidatus Poribacteria bacterium]|nr:DUF4338 domain-containing protein [Candidatus Poribacteria bacterium]
MVFVPWFYILFTRWIEVLNPQSGVAEVNGSMSMSTDSIIYISLQPKFSSSFEESEFLEFCCALAETKNIEATVAGLTNDLTLEILLNQSNFQNDKEYLTFIMTKRVILDLINQGWQLRFKNSKPGLSYSFLSQSSKDLVRSRHAFEREALMEKESVRSFVQKMERNGIFAVMRNGEQLVTALRRNGHKAIIPYLQFAEGNERCPHTGLKLMDIWRYFRYTWVNSYRSTPGRSIRILVRDAASPNHAIIGIASLGNTVIQQTVRDDWIGWNAETLVGNFDCPSDLIRWCSDTIDNQINDIYLRDLLQQGLYSESEVKNPTSKTIAALKRASGEALDMYRQAPEEVKYLRSTEKSASDWENRAKTRLYKSKRCAKLALLLSIRKTLQEERISDYTELLENKKLRTTLNRMMRVVKAEHVGESMMDITTCGAIAPYNHLLGGKLVSMLVCSPEVVKHYKEKYSQQDRIIASSMKGTAVRRSPNLVLLTTTSLYEVGSSQYNRIKIPFGEVGKGIEYKKLGLTEGFGTFHLSTDTLRLMELLIGTAEVSERINSVFGEGPSPLLRKIREALSLAGLPSDTVLNHKSRRIVYGVSLAENFRDILTGHASQPGYNLVESGLDEVKCTERIANYWAKRWLLKRMKNSGILEQVVQHTDSCHGARVRMVSDSSKHFDL